MSPERRRVIIGLLTAPLVGGAVWGILMSLTTPFPLEALSQLPALMILSSAIAVPLSLIVGGLVHSLFERFGMRSLAAYALTGLVGGTVLGAAVFGFGSDPEGSVMGWLLIGCSAAAGATYFWALVVRGEPRGS